MIVVFFSLVACYSLQKTSSSDFYVSKNCSPEINQLNCIKPSELGKYNFSSAVSKRKVKVFLMDQIDDVQTLDFDTLPSFCSYIEITGKKDLATSLSKKESELLPKFKFLVPYKEFKILFFQNLALSYDISRSTVLKTDKLVYDQVSMEKIEFGKISLTNPDGFIDANGKYFLKKHYKNENVIKEDLYYIEEKNNELAEDSDKLETKLESDGIDSSSDAIYETEIASPEISDSGKQFDPNYLIYVSDPVVEDCSKINFNKCLSPDQVSSFDFSFITNDYELILIMLDNVDLDNYLFNFDNLVNDIELVIGSKPEAKNIFNFKVPKIRFKKITFQNIELKFNIDETNIINTKIFITDGVKTQQKYCDAVTFPYGTIIVEGVTPSNCFHEMSEPAKVTTLYLTVTSSCSGWSPGSDIQGDYKCAISDQVKQFSFSELVSTTNKIEISLEIDLTDKQAFDFSSLKQNVDLHVNGKASKEFYLDVVHINSYISSIYFDNVKIFFITNLNHNSLALEKLYLINGCSLDQTSAELVDISKCKEADFYDFDLYNIFKSSAKKIFVNLDDSSSVDIKDGKATFKVNSGDKSLKNSAKEIVIKTGKESFEIKISDAKSATKIYLYPTSSSLTLTFDQITPDKKDFVFGIILNDKSPTFNINYPKDIIPMSIEGTGTISLSTTQETNEIRLTEPLMIKNISLNAKSGIRYVSTTDVTLTGDSPSLLTGSSIVKEGVTVNINNMVINGAQLASMDNIKIIKLMNIGPMSYLSCNSVIFDPNSILNIAYSKKNPTMPIINSKIIDTSPSSVNLHYDNKYDESVYPKIIKILKMTQESYDRIGFTDSSGIYAKDYFDGHLCTQYIESTHRKVPPTNTIIAVVVAIIVVVIIIITVVCVVKRRNRKWQSSTSRERRKIAVL